MEKIAGETDRQYLLRLVDLPTADLDERQVNALAIKIRELIAHERVANVKYAMRARHQGYGLTLVCVLFKTSSLFDCGFFLNSQPLLSRCNAARQSLQLKVLRHRGHGSHGCVHTAKWNSRRIRKSRRLRKSQLVLSDVLVESFELFISVSDFLED